MLRVGMMGADSTHTELYARLMNLPDGPFYGRAQVVKLWGADPAEARQKAETCRIPEVVSDPADVLDGVDLVSINNRYGDDHVAPARLALEAGKPTFVDKPFTNSLADARALAHLAAEHNAPLMSCSSLRYAAEVQTLLREAQGWGSLNLVQTVGPAAGAFPNPRASHPFFYGVHAVEMLHTLIGPGATSLTTHRTPAGDVVVLDYADERRGVVNLLRQGPAVYHAAVYAADGWGHAAITDHSGYYTATLGRILDMAETGRVACPIEYTLEIVAILDAITRSAEQGGVRVAVEAGL